jgi:hypothetical protein
VSKLVLAVSIIFYSAAVSAAQEPAPVQGALSSDLPNAPQAQLARALPSFSWKNMQSAKEALPLQRALPLQSLEGTRVTLSLISAVNSKMESGSAFQARLDQPIAVNGKTILPEGTLFEGRIETRHASRLMRPGSLFLRFEQVLTPGGDVQPVNVELVSSDSRAVNTDAEGMLHPSLSKKRLAIQLGGAGLSAKVADDVAELIAGSSLGAGTARIVGAGAAATFIVLQKGREVKIRPGDKLEVEFGRAGAAMPEIEREVARKRGTVCSRN